MSQASTLELAHKRASALTRRVPLQKADAGTRQFASWAVGTQSGKPSPAQWILDRTEFVRHYRNSVYIGGSAIGRKMAMQEAKCFRRITKRSGVKDEPLKINHPLCQLFREVNPIMTEWDLWYYTEVWKLLVGDSFWWKARNGFGTPVQIWPIPPQWVWAIPSATEYIGSYKVEGFFGTAQEVPASEIVHIKEPNMDWSGNGRFYGSPPLVASANTVDIEQAMFTRLYHSFRNYAPPGLIFSTDQRMQDAQLRQVYNTIINQHSLAEHTGRPMILHSGLKPHFPGGGSSGVMEMDYAQSLDATLTLTLAIMGVPKGVVGLVADQNRANLQAAIEAFCENTINPRLVQNGQHLTYGIARDFEPDGSLIVKFDPCTVNDAEQLRKDIETSAKYGATDPNEIREALSGRKDYVVGGNRPLVNAGMVEATFGNDEGILDDPDLDERTGMPQQAADDVDEMAKALSEFESIRKNRLTEIVGANGRY